MVSSKERSEMFDLSNHLPGSWKRHTMLFVLCVSFNNRASLCLRLCQWSGPWHHLDFTIIYLNSWLHLRLIGFWSNLAHLLRILEKNITVWGKTLCLQRCALPVKQSEHLRWHIIPVTPLLIVRFPCNSLQSAQPAAVWCLAGPDHVTGPWVCNNRW